MALRIVSYVILLSSTALSNARLDVRADLHFPLHARGTNKDGSLPVYKNPKASVEDRVNDLLPRMTLDEKVAQM